MEWEAVPQPAPLLIEDELDAESRAVFDCKMFSPSARASLMVRAALEIRRLRNENEASRIDWNETRQRRDVYHSVRRGAAEDERKACAKVAESLVAGCFEGEEAEYKIGTKIAAAIRNRK
jgi:hypothetical protein